MPDVTPSTDLPTRPRPPAIPRCPQCRRFASEGHAAGCSLKSGDPAVPSDGERSYGVAVIDAERRRQVEAEGWTPEHDAEHTEGSLISASVCYAFAALALIHDAPAQATESMDFWPWDANWWKPSDDPVRNLVKAGALIAAEIDRLAAGSDDV